MAIKGSHFKATELKGSTPLEMTPEVWMMLGGVGAFAVVFLIGIFFYWRRLKRDHAALHPKKSENSAVEVTQA